MCANEQPREQRSRGGLQPRVRLPHRRPRKSSAQSVPAHPAVGDEPFPGLTCQQPSVCTGGRLWQRDAPDSPSVHRETTLLSRETRREETREHTGNPQAPGYPGTKQQREDKAQVVPSVGAAGGGERGDAPRSVSVTAVPAPTASKLPARVGIATRVPGTAALQDSDGRRTQG